MIQILRAEYKLYYIFIKKLIRAKLWSCEAAVYTKPSRSWSKPIIRERSRGRRAGLAGGGCVAALSGRYTLTVCTTAP